MSKQSDIGFDPRTRVQAERKMLASQSLRAFSRLYLSKWTTRPDSQLHRELYGLLGSLPTTPGARIAVAAPRGSAKSTLVSQAFLLWSICYGHYRYIVLISDTAEKAADFLSHIKDELCGNRRLAEDFPNICELVGHHPKPPRWRMNEIITRNGVKVTAMGVGQNIRGRRHQQDRPGLVILDDIESPESAATPESRKRLDEWFHKSILKSGTPETRVVMVGTIVHYDSLLARLTNPAKSLAWTSRVYRSILSWSDHPEHWQVWAGILRGSEEYDGQTGPAAAMAFFEARREEMLVGTDVLWPENEDYYTLMVMRETEGSASFDSEKQNEPVNPADCLFLEEYLGFWSDKFENEQELANSLKDGFVLVGACDPSLGRHGKHADDSAIVTLISDNETGRLFVLDADIARRKPDEIIEDVLEKTERYGYAAFAFEANQFQSFLADELQRRSNQRGIYLPVVPIVNSSDKCGRIQSLQPMVQSGTLLFHRGQQLLLEQLRYFPKAAHDDGPDALEMAVRTLGDLLRRPATTTQIVACTPAFAQIFGGHFVQCPDNPEAWYPIDAPWLRGEW